MKRALLLFTHLGAASNILFEALSSHPRIDGIRTGQVYDHYDKVAVLTAHKHKNESAASIWMDEVFHNNQFTCKPLLECIQVMFLVREPKGSLASILDSHPEYDARRAADYYRYRLRGLCEYAQRSPGSPVIVSENMDLGRVGPYLGLKGIESPKPPIIGRLDIPLNLLEDCEECYERHLKHLIR